MKTLKTALLKALKPFAAIAKLAEPVARLWAHAKLSARLDTLGSGTVLLGMPDVHGTERIALGDDLYLYPDLYLETRENGRIALADRVVLSRGVHIVSYDEIVIGQGSMIGEYTSIRDANHSFGDGRQIREADHRSSPIVIGENVWIGRGVAILPGVTIGNNAVIGANAVVTRNIPADTVAVGVPAAPVQKGITT